MGRGSRPPSRLDFRLTAMADVAISDIPETSAARRKWAVHGGRLLLAAAIIAAWEYGARTLGPLFFAPPLDVLERIGAMVRNGQLVADIAATMRVSAAGFAIAAFFGVLIPFLLRRSRSEEHT